MFLQFLVYFFCDPMFPGTCHSPLWTPMGRLEVGGGCRYPRLRITISQRKPMSAICNMHTMYCTLCFQGLKFGAKYEYWSNCRILSELGEYWSSCKVIFYQAGFHTDWACHGNRKIRWMCTILNNWCVLDAFNIWKSFYSWTSQIGHPLL